MSAWLKICCGYFSSSYRHRRCFLSECGLVLFLMDCLYISIRKYGNRERYREDLALMLINICQRKMMGWHSFVRSFVGVKEKQKCLFIQWYSFRSNLKWNKNESIVSTSIFCVFMRWEMGANWTRTST